jgi:nitrogen regulatory protein PII
MSDIVEIRAIVRMEMLDRVVHKLREDGSRGTRSAGLRRRARRGGR